MDKLKLRELIQKVLSEESTTGSGGGSFTPGQSENYATPFAFKRTTKNKSKKKFQSKIVDFKQLWHHHLNEEEDLKNFIDKRLEGFQVIQTKLNELIPMIARAKKKTVDAYKSNPNYDIMYGTDIASSYLDDLIKLFKD